MAYLKPYVTGSNDDILNEVALTTAVTLVGAHHGPENALGHLLVVPLGNISLDQYDWPGLAAKLPRRAMAPYNRSLPNGGMMTLGYYYGLPGTNADEHSYGSSFGYLSSLPRVPIRCRKPLGSTL
jgi:hypothetical protein